MKKLFNMLLAGIFTFAGSQLSAGGFALIENSVSSMGTAYAGAGSIAEDATTIWFNPAGLMRLCGTQVVSGLHYIKPVSEFHKDHSVNFLRQPLHGNNGGDAGEPAGVANFYASWRIDDSWAVGLGINSPFGLVTDYDHKWVGRYYALRSRLLTININPTIAYRLNECWSFGAGFDVMYLHAKLSNKIDFGLIGALLQIPGFAPEQNNGEVKLKGNSWGYGGNVGILFEPTECTRIGLSYRTEIKHNIKGREKFKEVPGPFAGTFVNTGTKSDVTLPSSLLLSGYHQLNDCWAIVGDVMWTKWDIFNRLRFRFHSEQPDGITTLNWKNTWRGAVGVIFSPTCEWKIRAGIAYDQDPTPNKEDRSPRIPGSDRFWIAVGAGYQWSECVHLDFGYAHIYADTAKIDKSDFERPEEQRFSGGLRGKYNSYADIFSAQLVYNF